MKFIRKVTSLEVKRCFVVSDLMSEKYAGRHVYTRESHRRELTRAKRAVLALPEHMLDMIIRGEWRKRHDAYRRVRRWYLGTAKTSEIGVWKRAGGLPLAWTRDSLGKTAEHVSRALRSGKTLSRHRADAAIRGILKTSADIIQREKYLFPIILSGGNETRGRAGLRKMKGDIDDGCMRAIALATDSQL